MAGAMKATAPADRRYFISVETDFFDHPKTLVIGPELAFAVLASWAYCHKQLTDGILPEQAAKQILPHKRDRDRLVKHGWWEERKGGYLIHDYLKHQPSRTTMRQKSDAARNAAGIRWSVRANAEQHADEDPDEGLATRGKRTSDHAERIAKGNAESMPDASKKDAVRNAKGNASGNAERNAERHAELELDVKPDVPGSLDPVPSARDDTDDPFPEDLKDADRSRDRTRGGRRGPGLRHVGDIADELLAAKGHAS